MLATHNHLPPAETPRNWRRTDQDLASSLAAPSLLPLESERLDTPADVDTFLSCLTSTL